MKIVFVDTRLRTVDDSYSENNGMGGIASSIIYLADVMARRGHEVLLVANVSDGMRKSGVKIYSPLLPASHLRDADAIIVNNNSDTLAQVRLIVGPDVPVILWMHLQHHVYFNDMQCSAHGLDTEYRNLSDAIVFVSLWQRADFLRRYDIDPAKCHVIRNACNPFVCSPDADPADFFDEKRRSLEVAYVSAPDRGLETLLDLWPRIAAGFPDARLVVYSGQTIYGIDHPRERYNLLLASLNRPGIEYRGALNHARLAEHLRRTAVVAYPTAFEETSGIAILEALASGCQVVGSDRGALPESAAGFARIVPYGDGGEEFKAAFASSCCDALQDWREGAPPLQERLRLQSSSYRASHSWEIRAIEWESMIAFLQGARH